MGNPEAVLFIDQQIQGQAHGQVGADGGIHGNEGAFSRLVQTRHLFHHPVHDGLAVLGFADLEIGGIGGGFNEIARRVNLEQAGRLAPDLAAQDEAGGEFHIEFLEGFRIPLMHLPQGIPHQAGGLKHIGGVVEIRLVRGTQVLVENIHHGLADGQVTRGEEHQHPIPGPLPDVHFAEGVDVIHPRIGAGIGKKNQARIEPHGDAISHDGDGSREGGMVTAGRRSGNGRADRRRRKEKQPPGKSGGQGPQVAGTRKSWEM